MLDLQMLNAMPPGTRFAAGTELDSPEGLNMTGSGRPLRWVACRGKGMPDWAIYCHFGNEVKSLGEIADFGEKVMSEPNIRKLVPCDDEAFGMYRY